MEEPKGKGGKRINSGRPSEWKGINKGIDTFSCRLPITIHQALMVAKTNLSSTEIINKLTGASTSNISLDSNEIEYEIITPIELAELRNKNKQLAKDLKIANKLNVTINGELAEERADSEMTIQALKNDINTLEQDLANLQSKQNVQPETGGIEIEGVFVKVEDVQHVINEWTGKVTKGTGPRWKNMRTFWSILKDLRN